MNSSLNKEIKSLTSLRFFAALGVFLYHLFYFVGDSSVKGWSGLYFGQGHAGVTFFFILSGFILSYNYHDRMRGKGAVKDFWAARFARIYPVHLLAFLVSIPLFWNDVRTVFLKCLVKGAAQLFLLHSFVPSNTFTKVFNAPSWSISDEMFFYLMFPLILWAFRPAKRGVSRKALFGFAAAGISYGLWITLLKDHSLSYWMFYIFPLFRLLDFMTGMLLFAVYRRFSGEEQGSWGPGRWTGAEIVSLGLLWFSFNYSTFVHPAYRWGLYYLPFMSLVIYVFSRSKGAFAAVLSHPALVLLGEASYSFYMFHVLVFQYLRSLGLGAQAALMGGVALGTTTVLSVLCYRFYELPMKKWIKRSLLSPVTELSGHLG